MADDPRTVTPEQRAAEREVYAGAQEAGVKLAGLGTVDEYEDSFAGSKGNPVEIGQKITIRVRVASDGTLLPRREDSDPGGPPATSILTIQVIPSVEFDSGGDPVVVYNGYASQADVATSRIIATSKSGPTTAEWEALEGGREPLEYGNDPNYTDGMLELTARSREEAVTQALAPLVSGGKMNIGRLDRPERPSRHSGGWRRVAVTVGVPVAVGLGIVGFLTLDGSDSGPAVTTVDETADDETADGLLEEGATVGLLDESDEDAVALEPVASVRVFPTQWLFTATKTAVLVPAPSFISATPMGATIPWNFEVAEKCGSADCVYTTTVRSLIPEAIHGEIPETTWVIDGSSWTLDVIWHSVQAEYSDGTICLIEDHWVYDLTVTEVVIEGNDPIPETYAGTWTQGSRLDLAASTGGIDTCGDWELVDQWSIEGAAHLGA